jgi:DNA-binding transcriptional regulator GbsR (MarR family)
MSDGIQLSPGKQQFIEDMGLLFEQYGVARIGGRLLGLLILADRPLSLEAMATALGVSRSAISANIRVSVTVGLVERVSFPGDRRDYYRCVADHWELSARASIDRIAALRRVAERGLGALAPTDQVARDRLEELREYCAFMAAEFQASLARWRERRGAAAAAGPTLESVGIRP